MLSLSVSWRLPDVGGAGLDFDIRVGVCIAFPGV
jgi:hypothetical protein